MPYQSPEKLAALVDIALNDLEMQKGISEAKISRDRLKQDVLRLGEKAWKVASSQIAEYDSMESSLIQQKNAELEKSGADPGKRFHQIENGLSTIFSFGIVGILVLALFGIISWYVLLLFIPMAMLIGVAAWLKERASKAWVDKRADTEKSPSILTARQNLENFQKSIDKTIVEGSIKEIARAHLNLLIEPNYSPRLNIFEAPGLSEIMNSSHTIDTSSQKSLRFLLENMPGGSIGIAGPRGSGKSTLIHSYCGPNRTEPLVKGKKVFPVMVSAPVEYESRDFLLHLFSTLCVSALKIENVETKRPELPDPGSGRKLELSPVFGLLVKRLAPIFLAAGLIMVLLGLSVSATLVALDGKPARGNHDSNLAGQATPAPSGGVAGDGTALRTDTSRSSRKDTTVQNPHAPASSFWKAVVGKLEVNPGAMFTWGLSLILLALALPFVFLDWGDNTWRPWLRWPPGKPRMKPQEKIAEPHPYVQQARAFLKDIKFQQSYTTGWSGALKLPLGLEGAVNEAVTWSQNQMSNPELANALIEFIKLIPREQYLVVIGIDELDKIETDDKAQKFLNEIKSIFGQPDCFFLISVSENAMSNFERRGLPFRDAFDSSFDGVVHVDYLDSGMAKKLMERRVIGRPVPFFCLSHCLSGGLARDLIRAFRRILELKNESPRNNSLEWLCQLLVISDVRGKARATRISARQLDFDPDAGRLVELIHPLEGRSWTRADLLRAFQDLSGWVSALPGNGGTGESADILAKRKKLQATRNELSAYFLFSLTLLDFFNDALSESALKLVEESGGLDDIARARQSLAINPNITLSLLRKFRSEQGLPMIA